MGLTVFIIVYGVYLFVYGVYLGLRCLPLFGFFLPLSMVFTFVCGFAFVYDVHLCLRCLPLFMVFTANTGKHSKQW